VNWRLKLNLTGAHLAAPGLPGLLVLGDDIDARYHDAIIFAAHALHRATRSFVFARDHLDGVTFFDLGHYKLLTVQEFLRP
jgi:hypothetical protein